MSKLIPVQFPLRGYNETVSFAEQPERTTPSCLNVRSFDPKTGRNRGAQRAGLTKYIAGRINSANQVQYLTHLVSANTGAASSTSLNTRTITTVAIAGGTVGTISSGTFSASTNGSSALSSSAPVIYAAELFGNLYFADGVNTKYLAGSTNTVTSWTASAGSFPVNSGNYPRLITMWRGRIVMSGIKTDAANWFMSAVGDATDFDYAPATPVACQAVAGNTSEAGLIPDDIVNSIFPLSDHYMLFGGDHSLYLLKGDPAENGQFEKISSITGTAWGRPMVKDPNNNLFFIGSRGGVYRYRYGSDPVKLSSGSLDAFFAGIDLSNTIVTSAWNDKEMGVHFWLTNLDGAVSTHLYFDVRNNAFWLDQYGDVGFNPTAVHTLDGEDDGDRVVLLGGRDGYVRYLDVDASVDDTEAISSYVYLGPITGGPTTKIQAQEMQFQMSENTDAATYEVFNGSTADEAYTKTEPVVVGSLSAGRNRPDRRRWNAHYAWIKLSNGNTDEHWSFENASVGLVALGRAEQGRLT